MGLRTKLIALDHRVPLPLKMVALTIMISLSVWLALDQILTKNLTNIFHVQLTEELNERAIETSLGFDRHVKRFQDAAKLFVIQTKFSDYIEKQNWSAADNVQVKHLEQTPEWFPARSLIRTFTEPRYAILLDPDGRVREIYNRRKEPTPSSLLAPTQILIQKSNDQIFMTNLDETPYGITSQSYIDPKGKLSAILMLASPIDSEFIHNALKHFSEEHVVALLTAGKDPRILTSYNLKQLPLGTPVSTLKDHYLITGQELFDYGASELQIKLANFISLAKIESLTNTFISQSRQDRAITTFSLILVFTLIIYWITRHINKIIWHISYFSESFLGLKPRSQMKGDQLFALKERFHELTKEIMAARRTIKKQEEEKTRLIVESAFDAIATTNDKGIISSWNPTAETLFGWTSEEAVGKPIYDVIVPNIHENCRMPIKNIITKNIGQKSRCQVILNTYHRNGHEIPVEFSISSASQDSGPILIFIMRDTTERNRANNRIHHLLTTLTKAKDEWEMTFDSVTEQIMLVDKDLNLIRCNKSFANSMRSTVHKLIGSKCDEFMLCDPEWLSDIKIGKEHPERIEVKTYDGRWLYASTLPVSDENNIFMYTIITATDITDMKKAQQNLIESKHELDERIKELEKFYDMAVNRELKMIKLKKQLQKSNSNNGNSSIGTIKEHLQDPPNSAYLFNQSKQNHSN